MAWAPFNRGGCPAELRSSWPGELLAQYKEPRRFTSTGRQELTNWRTYRPGKRSSRYRMLGIGEDAA
jgi:hypothetical protein